MTTMTKQPAQTDLMQTLAQDALDTALAELAESTQADDVDETGAQPVKIEKLTTKALRRFISPVLRDGRIGSLVWWNAYDILADADAMKRAVLAVELRAACPKCEAMAGRRCVDAAGVETTTPCSERGPAMSDMLSDVAKPAEAMRRATSRSQSGIKDTKLRWYVGKEDADAKTLAVVLGQQQDAKAAGDPIATARWSLVVNTDTGALTLPPAAVLLDDEKRALHAMLTRYQKERTLLTSTQITTDFLSQKLFVGLGGVRCRNHGGMYLVPAPADEIVSALAPALSTVASVELRAQSVMQDDAAPYAVDAEAALEEEALAIAKKARAAVAALHASRLEEKTNKHRAPSIRKTAEMLDEVDAVRLQAKGFAKLLGALTDSVDKALKEAEDATREVLRDLTGGIV